MLLNSESLAYLTHIIVETFQTTISESNNRIFFTNVAFCFVLCCIGRKKIITGVMRQGKRFFKSLNPKRFQIQKVTRKSI